MTLYSLSTFSVLLILVALYPFPCKAYEDPNFQLGLEKLQYHNVTPEEINKWWDETQKRRQENQPRVFPICIAKDQTHGWPAAVKRFEKGFDKLTLIRKFDQEHTWKHRPRSLLIKFELRKMRADYPLNNQIPMDQWLTLHLQVSSTVRGIYIQSIGGPLGIPVGEFVDVRCTSGSTHPVALLPYQNIVPCSFSPRVSETNPNVLVLNYENFVGKPSRRLFFSFKWSEAQCQEIGYFQFIIIATADFNAFESVLSPIYRFNDLVTGTGLPTPLHIDYDNINCIEFPPSSSTKPPFTELDDGMTRIIPNKEYDDCILNGTGRGTTEIDKGTCPPGYFTCTTMWKTNVDWSAFIEKYWNMMVLERDNFKDCCEIGPIKDPPSTTTTKTTTTKPTTTTTTTTKSTTTMEIGNLSSTSEVPLSEEKMQLALAVKQDKYLTKKTKRNEKIHQVTHGDLCILVWLVLIPMSDHISRFLKDLPDFESVGLGFWIIAHIGLHSGSLILVWLSFGLVVGSGDDKLGNIGVRHFLLGFVCTAIQHAQFITGLKRNLKERESFYYVLSHSLSGYISHFFGLVDVALSNAGTERKWLTVGFFLVWLACTLASYYVEKVQDRRIGMTLHRAQCPVLQRVVMEGGKNPPLMGVKLGILAFMVISQLSMFTVMLVYYEASATVDRKIQELRGNAN